MQGVRRIHCLPPIEAIMHKLLNSCGQLVAIYKSNRPYIYIGGLHLVSLSAAYLTVLFDFCVKPN